MTASCKAVFYESLWRTTLAVMVALILIACCNAGATSALLIGAHVALVFAMLMILNATQSADRNVSPQRMSGQPGTLMLKFAKGGSAAAIGLSGGALVI